MASREHKSQKITWIWRRAQFLLTAVKFMNYYKAPGENYFSVQIAIDFVQETL